MSSWVSSPDRRVLTWTWAWNKKHSKLKVTWAGWPEVAGAEGKPSFSAAPGQCPPARGCLSRRWPRSEDCPSHSCPGTSPSQELFPHPGNRICLGPDNRQAYYCTWVSMLTPVRRIGLLRLASPPGDSGVPKEQEAGILITPRVSPRAMYHQLAADEACLGQW